MVVDLWIGLEMRGEQQLAPLCSWSWQRLSPCLQSARGGGTDQQLPRKRRICFPGSDLCLAVLRPEQERVTLNQILLCSVFQFSLRISFERPYEK